MTDERLTLMRTEAPTEKITKHAVRLVKVYEAPSRKDEEGRVWSELITDMHFATAQVGWAVGGRQFLHTVDGGRSWINQFSNRQDCPQLYPQRVSAVSAKTCWVLARLSPTSMSCCFTRDGGKTWNGKEFDQEIHPIDLFFIDSKRGWLASDNGALPANEGRLHITRDGGKTWVATETQTAGQPYRVRFQNESKGWLIEHFWIRKMLTHTRLHTSSDEGSSWQQTARFERELLDLQVLDDERLCVCGETGFIARSLDGGMNWKRVDTRSRANINALQFYQSTIGLALGDFNTLLLTTDAGDNWERIKVPYDAGSFIRAHFTSSRNGVIASDHGLHAFELDL